MVTVNTCMHLRMSHSEVNDYGNTQKNRKSSCNVRNPDRRQRLSGRLLGCTGNPDIVTNITTTIYY